ncbi:MAG: GNAT family N-acetyltransferase [Actinomycetota bacterium]|nr:GNAT family N-acetyltransferase [Actinomycetota bacterium]
MAEIPAIETERLLLRAFRHEDTDAFAALCADDEVMRWVGGTMERGRAWRHMAALTGHWTLRGYGRWAVEIRATGELAGHVGLWFPEGWPAIEVGWTLARAAWGQGIATEAATASLDYAWREVGLDRVISLIDPANERSQSVARKLGMRPTDERFVFDDTVLTIWEALRPG